MAAHLLTLAVILILIMFSALLSGSESAFFSLKARNMALLSDKNSAVSRKIIYLHDRPKMLLATILISNTLVNIMIAIISTQLLDSIFPQNNVFLRQFVEVIGITFVLVLFCEVVPKIYATHNHVSFARLMAYPVLILSRVFLPLSLVLIRFTNIIEKRLGNLGQPVSIDEIRHAIEITTQTSSSEEERNILHGIINFSNIYVKQIMCPRTDMKAFEAGENFTALTVDINESRYSRVPVYRDNLDNVIGILYIKDLIPYLDEGADFDWNNLIRQPFFVPEAKKIDLLLQEFRTKKVHLAVVVDEYGGTAGLVTLEDIVEEIVGDINDEFDEVLPLYSRLDENDYIFDGKATLTDVARIINVNEDTFDAVRGDAESIGGLMIEMAGKMPELHEQLHFERFHFTIEQADHRRVLRVKLSIDPEIKTPS